MNEKAEKSQSIYAWAYDRYRNEIVLETGFLVLCFLLAIGLEVKIVVAVTIACFKFAIPDLITSFLVLKNDPSRCHGVCMAANFVATGMARASMYSSIVLMLGACIVVPILAKLGLGNIGALGLGFSFIWAAFFILSVFPTTLFGLIISQVAGTQVSFATGLTKLRRSADDRRDTISLNINQSLSKLAAVSGISLGIWFVILGFALPMGEGFLLDFGALIIVALAFGAPFGWIFLFEKLTLHKTDSHEYTQ